jgi:hypothetical protein
MTELVLEKSCRSYDIRLFRYERFQEGRLSPGKYRYSIIG